MGETRSMVQINEVLCGTSAAIYDLLEIILPIENAMGVFLSNTENRQQNRHQLQNIDLLVQSVEAISKFLADVAEILPEDMCVDTTSALAGIKLGALRHQLNIKICEKSRQAQGSTNPSQKEHCHLFKDPGDSPIELF